VNHVYILGAGRSGTTLLATLLGANGVLRSGGELLHLPVYWRENRRCSCGLPVRDCESWRDVGAALGEAPGRIETTVREFAAAERHRNVLRYLFAPWSIPRRYVEQHEAIFDAVAGQHGIVDASKYVARALALTRLEKHEFRYVYIVRDCRGTVYSMMKKKAQKSRSLPSALVYWLSVNVAAQLAVWTRLRGRAIKVRYEDIVREPERELARIGEFLGVDMSDVIRKVRDAQPIDVGHIVSGNRLRALGSVKVAIDEEWRRNFGLFKRVGLYLACLPIQIGNRYRL
jgi:hypothetical protein